MRPNYFHSTGRLWSRLVRLVVVLAIVAFGAARPAFATLTVPMRFERLVGDASAIFRGEVVDVRSEWRQMRGESVIVTVIQFRVERVLKGHVSALQTLEILGGAIGDTTMAVPGMPQFSVGDRDLLCLERAGALFPVLGASQGRFRVLTDRRGHDRVVFSDGRPVGGVMEIGRAAVVVSSTPVAPMTLSGFESTIEEELARARR
ncbi:MAG: hypothetical protein ACRD2N_10080 [Vicinamibacterales bacterium]